MKWIEKNIGCIVLVIVAAAILAPIIFTLPGFECFNKTTTGQIGDTIGGTTAPFWGFLSVILLYLTFREQRVFNREQLSFNRTQQAASDYEILMKIRDNISSLCNALELNIVHQKVPGKSQFKGASFIEELRNTTHPDNYIEEAEFDKLYKNVVEIAELCLLYYNLIQQSSLENGLKKAFFQSISIHSEYINRLFFLYLQKNINIIKTTCSTEDDLFERYKNANERIIEQFKNAKLALQNIQ
ncbi:hypothetical protein [Bacteroides caccae]|jgi:hypothetical protein|uniref:hypothetical protein n=1 Tax=Bacteroides caccae TaxID=47678 RepID=UPI00207050AC|nr:MAG TPA: hypothetical protein [Caudoviricetes sp.]